jgi:hypothetical protein
LWLQSRILCDRSGRIPADAGVRCLSAGGIGTLGIMRRTGKSKTCVWRRQERFAERSVDGL